MDLRRLRCRDGFFGLNIGLVLLGGMVFDLISTVRLKGQVAGGQKNSATFDPTMEEASLGAAADSGFAGLSATETGLTGAPEPMERLLASATPASFVVAGEPDAEPGYGVTLAPVGVPMPLDQCPYDRTKDRRCRMHWRQMALSASLYLAFQNVGNAYTGYWYRWETTNGKWWDRYVNSVEDWRWKAWQDQNPFLDDYVGHPMMGAITNSIWEQNDPKGMTVVQANDWVYYRSRLRATAFSTFFSFEWKLGPIGEAGMHNGDHFFYEKGSMTNETGWVELVTTPVGGLAWNIGEDYLDRTLIPRLEEHSRNPLMLMSYSLLTPAKTMANILRFRPPWYRDSRVVKARSFWSDPDGDAVRGASSAGHFPAGSGKPVAAADTVSSFDSEGLSAAWERVESPPAGGGETAWASGQLLNASYSSPARGVPVAYVARTPKAYVIPSSRARSASAGPMFPLQGGVHEFGVIWGFSTMSGHVWGGTVGDVKTMPIAVRYSYLLHEGGGWALRYSPEFTAMAMIDWPTPITNLSNPNYLYNQRTRAYGSGVSPVGVQMDILPASRVQPFFGSNEGAIYYDQPVLAAGGPRLMYTVDFGGGVNIFRKHSQAVTIGYRYQHLTGTGAASQTVSTDTNMFYVGVSRFRTKRENRVQ